MKFNESATKDSFIFPISNRYYSFLNERQALSEEYRASLENGCVGMLLENVLMIQGRPFCVNCILGESSENIFDIIKTNRLYNLPSEEGTVFAVLYGDDYLFFKPNDSRIYYKSISTDNVVLLANTYNEFLSMIFFEEDDQNLVLKQDTL